jgi:transcriptional regulator with XRE-family HTH domain
MIWYTARSGIFRLKLASHMPRVSRLKLAPLNDGGEMIGERVARLRKERGYTQTELAQKIGIIQTIVSAIEKGTLKLSAEMAIRFAVALEVSTDDLLMPAKKRAQAAKPSRKVLRRLELIETLPTHQQQTVLKSLDMMLTGLKSAS